jgi:hypothetical protein
MAAGMLILLHAIAIALAPATAAPIPPQLRPLRLITESAASGVRMSVLGLSATTCTATYALEVSSGPAGNNRSVQRGVARLAAGVPAVVARVSLGGATTWSARLAVGPCGAAPGYSENARPEPRI